jgi:hypothetical protein
VRRPDAATWLAGAVFVGALVSRSVWLRDAFFHPDASTVLWMALDAVRDPQLPDHGLISSNHVFQPPGLVWATMPLVALGDGRPEVVIVGFALLNAAAAALLVATVGRLWGLVYAAVLGSFLVVGPDAFFSAWVWHPSLYTAAVALLLTAGIRLRAGSVWWAALLVAVPGLYTLVHYSGFVLFGPALVLLVLSRRWWTSVLAPLAIGTVAVLCAWVPFLSFESDRGYVDLETVAGASDVSSSLGTKLEERVDDLVLAVTHLAQIPEDGPAVELDTARLLVVLWPLVLAAVAIAVLRRRWRDPGFAYPAAVLGSGMATQVALAQGDRADILFLWLVPCYALAAWGVVQLVELGQSLVPRAAVAPAVAGAAVALVVWIGIGDLSTSIDAMPPEHGLSEKWRVARSDAPVVYAAAGNPRVSENRYYLPCDPPYDWGSEVWYLREVLDSGTGLEEAVAGGAFRAREGLPCER